MLSNFLITKCKFVSVARADMLQELESLKSWMIFMTLLVAVALVLMSVTLAFIWSREWKIRNSKNGGKDSYFKKKLAFLKVNIYITYIILRTIVPNSRNISEKNINV